MAASVEGLLFGKIGGRVFRKHTPVSCGLCVGCLRINVGVCSVVYGEKTRLDSVYGERVVSLITEKKLRFRYRQPR